MDKDTLKIILDTQKEDLKNYRSNSVMREVDVARYLGQEEITIIKGVRRCGKSTLLEEALRSSRAYFNTCLYCNFEDPQLIDFTHEDFLKLYEIWTETYPQDSSRVAIFDEVQNVIGWERWMNFFAKQKRFKVFVTGSNSNLISAELGTHLTGRYTQTTLYPFSFGEILGNVDNNLKNKIHTSATTEDLVKLEFLTKQYLKYGGFPKSWLAKDNSILQEYYQHILARDIARRKKIKNIPALEKFGTAVMNNVGRKINKSKMAETIGLKSGYTVEKYLTYFEESYLGFQIQKYDPSIRKQLRNYPKFYAIDPGMALRTSLPSDSKNGFYLENIVLIELLRRGAKVFYWNSDNNSEIDFVVETKDGRRQLVQVAWSIESNETLEREMSPFEDFERSHKNLSVDDKIIVTLGGGKNTTKKNITILPFGIWSTSYSPEVQPF